MTRSPGSNQGHGPEADCPYPGERGARGARDAGPRESILRGLAHVVHASRAGSLPPEECGERLVSSAPGAGFYDCGWRSRLPWRPTTKMRAPRRVHCCSGPALALTALKRGARAPELQMGWTGGEVLAGGKQGGCPCPRLPGAGGSARPYLGGGIRGGDDRVPRRSRRHLSRGAATAHGLGLGRRRAPRLRLLRAPLLRGAPGSHDFFTVLPRPAARFCLLQIAGTRGRAREAVRPRGPESPVLSRSSFQRAQTANAGDALAANSLKEKKKKGHLVASSSSPLFFPRFITCAQPRHALR